jgi:hypothetical protein
MLGLTFLSGNVSPTGHDLSQKVSPNLLVWANELKISEASSAFTSNDKHANKRGCSNGVGMMTSYSIQLDTTNNL